MAIQRDPNKSAGESPSSDPKPAPQAPAQPTDPAERPTAGRPPEHAPERPTPEKTPEQLPERRQPGTTPAPGNGNGGNGDHPRRARGPSQPMELAAIVRSEDCARRITESLPRHMTPERWISVLLNVNQGDNLLQKCSPRSIVSAALQGAVLGLDFSKTLREAYLIPRSYERRDPVTGDLIRDEFGKPVKFYEATFMPGYMGLRKLAMNGGEITNVRSALVYESELAGVDGKFCYRFTPDLEFVHEPSVNRARRGDVALAYAVAKLRSGEHIIEVMTIDEVESSAHQRSSMYQSARQAKREESGPWVTDREMMIRKTVFKRLCNQLPMSSDLQTAIDIDNQAYVSSLDPSTGRLAIEQGRRGRGSRTLADRLALVDGGMSGNDEALSGKEEIEAVDAGRDSGDN